MSKLLTVPNLHGVDCPVWTLDFETFYDPANGYSLNKMTTAEYIRDSRFKAHGVAVVDPEGFSFWVTHKDLKEFFASIVWTDVAVNAHNSLFDMLVLHEIYNIEPNYYIDTMFMSLGDFGSGMSASHQALCERLGRPGKIAGALASTAGIRNLSCTQEGVLAEYGIDDAEKGRANFEDMYFERGFPELEMHIIDQTVRMGAAPVLRLNAALCKAEIEEEEKKLIHLLTSDLVGQAELSEICKKKLRDDGVGSLMASPDCFAQLIRSRGLAPPMKPSPTHPEKDIYAFAKNDLELIALGEDPRVSDLVAARIGVKSTLKKTRAETFLRVTSGGTKALPVPLKYCGARTHRWSGTGGINLQNLSAGRDGTIPRLRQAIEAPKGWRIASIDASQIECRVHAWLWNETDLLDAFASGGDPYSELASAIFGVHVTKSNEYSHLRPIGKAGELSLGFGVGWRKFAHTIRAGTLGPAYDISDDDALRAVETYRGLRTQIVDGWGRLRENMYRMMAHVEPFWDGIFEFHADKIRMPNNLFVHYRKLHTDKNKETNYWEMIYEHQKHWTRIYPAKVGQNNTQSVARTIIGQQALEIAREFRIVLLVHDEVVFLVPENDADAALAYGINALRTPPSWCSDLPLDAEGGHAHNYSK